MCFSLGLVYTQVVSGLRFIDFVSKLVFFMQNAQVFVQPGQESLQAVACMSQQQQL